jgi:hypothetical protein
VKRGKGKRPTERALEGGSDDIVAGV